MGHNVSFDRSYIKEQYLLKVSIQRVVCFCPCFLFGSLPTQLSSTFAFLLYGLMILITLINVPSSMYLPVYDIKRFISLKGSKVRFMDTMSLHMAISGLTGFQRTLWMASKLGKRRGLQEVKEHIKKVGQKGEGPAVCVFYSLYFVQHAL